MPVVEVPQAVYLTAAPAHEAGRLGDLSTVTQLLGGELATRLGSV